MVQYIKIVVWQDYQSGVVIRPESVVIGSRDQLRHIATVSIVNSRFLERQHYDFSSIQLLLTLNFSYQSSFHLHYDSYTIWS